MTGTGKRPAGRPRNAALDGAILAAAERQLGERGYARMSLESIAAAAGTTVPSVRRRFGSKADIAEAVVQSLRVADLPATAGPPRAHALAILENFHRNLHIVDEVKAVATEAGATPAQVALAWLLAQGNDIAQIPGTKRIARVEENTAADGLELSTAQIERLNNLTPAAGERHSEGNMAVIDR